MSNNENGDLNETENNVEGASNAKNTDDSGDVRQEKKLPFNEELRNSDENVGLGSDEKMDDAAKYENVGLGSDEKDVVMQDAAKCKDAASDVVVEEENEKMEEEKVEGKNGEEEKGAPYYEGSVASGVNAVIPDARSVEVGNGNQDVVEVTVSVKDASVGDILKNSNGKGNDREDTKLGSQDNGGDNAKESSTKNEGSDVGLLNQKSLVEKSGDDQKGDELKKDGSLEVKPLASGNETGSNVNPLETKAEGDEKCLEKEVSKMDLSPQLDVKNAGATPKLHLEPTTEMKTPNNAFLLESADGYESGTEEEQVAFLKDVEKFHKENNLEFKPPKFYKEELNLLKLWRSVIKLGGYEQVTSCKLWRQVGESFKPPKTCTTVSWTFRIFYEKALLEYEKGKLRNGELPFSDGTMPEAMRDENQGGGSQALGSGRARRDAAARAMQGWHSQRVLSNGQVSQPIIKDKNLSSLPKIDKLQKTNGLLKRKKPSGVEQSVSHVRTVKQQGDSMVIDIGPPADWVKINVQRTNDCFEVYALVPGLLREEVHVQSDPAGRLIISGQPEQLDNPWGVTPFKKVVSLPSRIDPHQTSAVVTLHGQLFVRVPFEQSEV